MSLPTGPSFRSAAALVAVVMPIAALILPGTFASASGLSSPLASYGNGETDSTFQGPVDRARCGKGSKPEVDIQGRVPASERESGASSAGYRCNLKLVGNYGPDDPQGFEGAEWQLARYKHCAYYGQRLFGGSLGGVGYGSLDAGAPPTGPQQRPGTVVVDVSNPRDPTFATNIFTLGMAEPWESLKVHAGRGLLVAANATNFQGPPFMGVYDVSQDCTKPVKLFDGPIGGINHEGSFSADGMTYYSAQVGRGGLVHAIDLADPGNPTVIAVFPTGRAQHGLSTSRDGRRLFVSHMNDEYYSTLLDATAGATVLGGSGVGVYDISEIQDRKANPQVREVSGLAWRDGHVGQHTVPFAKGNREYVIAVEEAGHGGARIVDITDETQPTVISKIKTEIMMADKRELALADISRPPFEKGGAIAPFGYNFHYCNVDRVVNPAMLACSAFNQGLRVFDIRDLAHPKEIAYYNPGGDGTLLPGSWGGTFSGYPAAMPQFVPERKELWFTDMDRGLFVVRFTSGSWISKATSSSQDTR